MFSARTRVRLDDAPGHAATLAAHMAEHGHAVSREGGDHRIAFADGDGRLATEPGAIEMTATAASREALNTIQYELASHLGEQARAARPEILWSGDGAEIPSLPNLRNLRVAACRQVTPRVRRLTLAGSDLRRFADPGRLHIKLLLPPDGADAPSLPRLGADGLVDWGPETLRPALRKYTIRRIDADAGEMDIDFVLHEDGGPGARFAQDARVGDRIDVMGPGGGAGGVADWVLFAGDETALPAIARLIGALPAGVRGRAFLEVADAAEEQAIGGAADIDVVWLHRNGVPPGLCPRLAEHVARCDWPAGGSVFGWAGTEFDAFRRIRQDWRGVRGLTAEQHLAVAYWRRDPAHAGDG